MSPSPRHSENADSFPSEKIFLLRRLFVGNCHASQRLASLASPAACNNTELGINDYSLYFRNQLLNVESTNGAQASNRLLVLYHFNIPACTRKDATRDRGNNQIAFAPVVRQHQVRKHIVHLLPDTWHPEEEDVANSAAQ
jgi:hypothetical protein